MRVIILAFGVILSVVIQATWLTQLNLPAQVKPDLVFIIVVSYALLKGPYIGTNLGLFAGFFMDLASGNIIGVGVLTKMLAGFSAGLLEKTIFKDNLLVPAIAVYLGTILFETLNLIIYISFGANFNFFHTILHTVLPVACYNAILAPVIYHLLHKMDQFISERASDF
ncbi:MAG TPA: rod shape-determining protein MreD [Bacillota bacterium]|nr:rod shape-determining protein MreD [Bacillota bacterium]